MKSLTTITLAIASTALIFTACDKKAEAPAPPAPTPAPKAPVADTKKEAEVPATTPATPPPAPEPAPVAATPPTPPTPPPSGTGKPLDPAFTGFKAEIEAVQKFVEEKQKTPPADAAAMAAMTNEILTKFKSVKTTGLPADFTAAWGAFTGVLNELGEAMKSMPATQPKTKEEEEKLFSELMPKMMKLQEKMEPIAKKLDEVGKKLHGLEELGKLAPGGG